MSFAPGWIGTNTIMREHQERLGNRNIDFDFLFTLIPGNTELTEEEKEYNDRYLKYIFKQLKNKTMSNVRAKVTCTQANKGEAGGISVNFVAVTAKEYDKEGNSQSENASFSRWTPSLNLSMYISPGTGAVDAFEVGKEYYLDFSEAPE